MAEPLRVALVVQGEGRGHMTQALAAQEMLQEAGHRVCGVFVGRSEVREIPAFFRERAAAEVEAFDAPVLVPDHDRTGMSAAATALYNLRRIPRYVESSLFLARRLRELEPDVVMNFFDLLGSIVLSLFQPGERRLAVGHHYLLGSPDFPRPPGTWIGWHGLRALTWLAGRGVHRRLALSFRPGAHPDPATEVHPPLLRRAVRRAEPEAGRHLLVYVLNPGYERDLRRWHAGHRDVPVEAFWDRTDVPATLEAHANLRFHRVDEARFLECLRTCRAVATTAGFETVCEALYLDKPALVVPTPGHVEQACNALDAEAAGAGIRRRRFELDDLLAYVPRHDGPDEAFRRWVDQAPGRLLSQLEDPAADRARSTGEVFQN